MVCCAGFLELFLLAMGPTRLGAKTTPARGAEYFWLWTNQPPTEVCLSSNQPVPRNFSPSSPSLAALTTSFTPSLHFNRQSLTRPGRSPWFAGSHHRGVPNLLQASHPDARWRSYLLQNGGTSDAIAPLASATDRREHSPPPHPLSGWSCSTTEGVPWSP